MPLLAAAKKRVVRRIIGGVVAHAAAPKKKAPARKVVAAVPVRKKVAPAIKAVAPVIPVVVEAARPKPNAPVEHVKGQPYRTLVHGTVAQSGGYYGHTARAIADPAILVPDVKYAERTPFLQGLFGEYNFDLSTAGVKLKDLPAEMQRDPKVNVAFNSYESMAQHNARLPKFSKWICSVFPDFKDLHDAIARAMSGNQADTIIVAGDAISLFNGGNSPHFQSCLTTAAMANDKMVESGSFVPVMKKLLSTAPGICVAYILDRKSGFMKGRIWIHHATHKEKGDALLIAAPYGCLTKEQLVKVLSSKFPNIPIMYSGYGGDVKNGWELVGYPNDLGHWDTGKASLGAATYLYHPLKNSIGQKV